MSEAKRDASEREQKRRAHQREASLQQLLYSREQARVILGGICVMTLRRLEARGALTPVRLNKSPNSRVFYRAADVQALVDRATS